MEKEQNEAPDGVVFGHVADAVLERFFTDSAPGRSRH